MFFPITKNACKGGIAVKFDKTECLIWLQGTFIVTLVLSLHAVKEWMSRGKLHEMRHSADAKYVHQ